MHYALPTGNISLLPSNPFQAGCSIAQLASTAFGIAECVGAGVTLASCAVSITGVGSVGTAGISNAICAGYIDLTTTTLLPDCGGFILSEFVKYYSSSPSASAGLDFVQLSIDPIPTDPLDYAVALCDVSNSGTPPSLGSVVSPVAGAGGKASSIMDGSALGIELNSPTGIAIDGKGNVYFDDDGNNAILELNVSENNQVTTFAGIGTAGFSGDGGAATNEELDNPTHLAFDSHGNLYIADAGNNRIRMVNTAGLISTVAGTGTAGFSGDGRNATQAELNFPDSIAFDAQDNLYIADTSNNRIRMVTPTGVISTFAGTGTPGYNYDDILATNAELNEPTRVAIDSAGNLYITDLLNNRVREVSAGVITTIAGNGTAGMSPDGTTATNAELNQPISIALDASGNVYIAELGNKVIRAINRQQTPITLLGVQIQPGEIATVVGGGQQSDTTTNPTLSVSLTFPTGLLTDASGNLYFADADNNIILRAK